MWNIVTPIINASRNLTDLIKRIRGNPSSNATYRKYALDPDNKGHMPRFDDKLDAEEINLLADWVRKTARAASQSRHGEFGYQTVGNETRKGTN